MKNLFFIALMSMFTISCGAQETNHYKVLTPANYEEAIKKTEVTIIDVRTPGEYAEGYIKNAKNINVNDPNFQQQLKNIDKSKPVYIYCRSGARSNRAGRIMESMGFTKIYDLQGGILSWRGKLSQ